MITMFQQQHKEQEYKLAEFYVAGEELPHKTLHNNNGRKKVVGELMMEQSLISKDEMEAYVNNILDVCSKLEDIEKSIKEADNALMFSWLGASREFFADVSACVQERINTTHVQ